MSGVRSEGRVDMTITVKVTGRMYDDIISAMVIEARLKTILQDAYHGMAKVRRQGDIVTMMIPGYFGSDDIIGMKETLAAEIELIANVAFMDIKA